MLKRARPNFVPSEGTFTNSVCLRLPVVRLVYKSRNSKSNWKKSSHKST